MGGSETDEESEYRKKKKWTGKLSCGQNVGQRLRERERENKGETYRNEKVRQNSKERE